MPFPSLCKLQTVLFWNCPCLLAVPTPSMYRQSNCSVPTSKTKYWQSLNSIALSMAQPFPSSLFIQACGHCSAQIGRQLFRWLVRLAFLQNQRHSLHSTRQKQINFVPIQDVKEAIIVLQGEYIRLLLIDQRWMR